MVHAELGYRFDLVDPRSDKDTLLDGFHDAMLSTKDSLPSVALFALMVMLISDSLRTMSAFMNSCHS